MRGWDGREGSFDYSAAGEQEQVFQRCAADSCSEMLRFVFSTRIHNYLNYGRRRLYESDWLFFLGGGGVTL